jgi:hypothetical protein
MCAKILFEGKWHEVTFVREDMVTGKDTWVFLDSKMNFTDVSKTATIEWTTRSKRLLPIKGIFHDPRLTDTGRLKSPEALGLPKGLELFCPKPGSRLMWKQASDRRHLSVHPDCFFVRLSDSNEARGSEYDNCNLPCTRERCRRNHTAVEWRGSPPCYYARELLVPEGKLHGRYDFFG